MKQEITLEPTKTKVTADCWGCDYSKDFAKVVKKGFLGIGTKVETKWACLALNQPISEELMNAYDMTKEDCPCHFKDWQQTNSELDEFIHIPTYVFRIENDKIMSCVQKDVPK